MNSDRLRSPRPPAALQEPPFRPRGRGAAGRVAGRFDSSQRIASSDEQQRLAQEGESPATQLRSERARSILSWNNSPDVPFDRSINPYRGCEHGCVYCFARPTHSYLGLSPGLDFETRLVAKVNAAELLQRELAAPAYRCAPITIGSATDAYQPVERRLGITRQLIQVLAEHRHPLSIITKSSLVERDIDLLAPMAQQGLASVYLSVTTLDDELARHWEPRAAAPWRRLQTLRRLSDAGIPVGVSLAPVVPFLNDHEMERILQQAHEAGARSAFYTMLRLPWEVRDIFVQWLRNAYPDRAERVLKHIEQTRSGSKASTPTAPTGASPTAQTNRRLNDARFFHRMRGEGEWARLLELRFGMACKRLRLNVDRTPLRSDLFQVPATSQAGNTPGQADLFSGQELQPSLF